MLSNKKGTHVGKILSFVIFIIFIVYIYLIAQPNIETNQNKQDLLDYLKIELDKNLSTELEITTFSLSSPVSGNCIKFRKLIEIYLDGNKRIIVRNMNKKILNSSVSPNSKDLFVQRENINDDIIKIYCSEEIDELPTKVIAPCEEIISNQNYTLKSVIKQNKISEKKIISLLDDYSNDYEQLKIDLNLPNSIDFGLMFEYENKTEIGTPKKDNKENIYFEKYPIEYFNDSYEIKFGFLTINVM
jgi:hypothetical protein